MDKQECIERQLESALLEGRWGVFERLPSERGLAEAFGVNRATVRAALRALAGRGTGPEVRLTCAEENTRAMRLYDRLGFSRGAEERVWFSI